MPTTSRPERRIDRSLDAGALVIEAAGPWQLLNVRELWAYRTLFSFLVWRDLKVRYSQTVLGIGWAVLQPLLTTVVFTIIFGRLAKIPSDGTPYAVFSLTALVPWTFFSGALSNASASLVSNSNLITKVYFPRLLIPWAPLFAGLVDYAIGVVIVFGFMIAYHLRPAPSAAIVLPVATAVMVLTASGMGCWLAALNIQYRDVRFVVPFFLQIWMYASPIVYPMSMVPPRWRTLYAMNPMAGVIEALRASLLGRTHVPVAPLAIALLVSVLLCAAGALYFRRTERIFADVA